MSGIWLPQNQPSGGSMGNAFNNYLYRLFPSGGAAQNFATNLENRNFGNNILNQIGGELIAELSGMGSGVRNSRSQGGLLTERGRAAAKPAVQKAVPWAIGGAGVRGFTRGLGSLRASPTAGSWVGKAVTKYPVLGGYTNLLPNTATLGVARQTQSVAPWLGKALGSTVAALGGESLISKIVGTPVTEAERQRRSQAADAARWNAQAAQYGVTPGAPQRGTLATADPADRKFYQGTTGQQYQDFWARQQQQNVAAQQAARQAELDRIMKQYQGYYAGLNASQAEEIGLQRQRAQGDLDSYLRASKANIASRRAAEESAIRGIRRGVSGGLQDFRGSAARSGLLSSPAVLQGGSMAYTTAGLQAEGRERATTADLVSRQNMADMDARRNLEQTLKELDAQQRRLRQENQMQQEMILNEITRAYFS